MLPGYNHVRPLGSGGFADVFLYEQSMPRRRVAVKVLLPGVADNDARAMFLSETNLMAQLADHPDVLTVYEAAIAADGRPYLVMEYCPESYGRTFRTERLPVAEVLQIAVAIGGVLETAHRDGVLHRDVKPANILKTSYGRPVLADFGIAATLARSEGQEALGLSIPWSSPEVVRGTTQGTVRSEIWAFGATAYGLLAGRSPFEKPDGDNSRDAVQSRIIGRARVAPTGRGDVPASLEQLLSACLSKDPALRPASMLEVLRSLQAVEAELGMRPSPLVIPTASVIDSRHLASAPHDDSTGASQGAGAADTATHDGSTATSTTRRPRTRSRLPADRSTRTGRGGTADDAVSRADATELRTAPGARSARRRSTARTRIALVACGVAVVAGVIVTVSLATRGGGSIPTVGTISANTTADSVQFSWRDPGLGSGDTYLVRVDGGQGTTQRSTTYTLRHAATQGQACVTVTVVRDGTDGAPSSSTCAGG
ncbi:serine/threonine protein kinase [Frondihabitans australicus]|uniref:non-specific serine/threonine protein kinase n=1 Tax=Frondihabitans australicus TaxID=386892 RepID=A0A495IFH6_9MICO|nr:serine/threonine protein kinase [Frondihabitans australicus]